MIRWLRSLTTTRSVSAYFRRRNGQSNRWTLVSMIPGGSAGRNSLRLFVYPRLSDRHLGIDAECGDREGRLFEKETSGDRWHVPWRLRVGGSKGGADSAGLPAMRRCFRLLLRTRRKVSGKGHRRLVGFRQIGSSKRSPQPPLSIMPLARRAEQRSCCAGGGGSNSFGL